MLRDWDCGGETSRTRAFWTFPFMVMDPTPRPGAPSHSVMATTYKRGKSTSQYVADKGFLPGSAARDGSLHRARHEAAVKRQQPRMEKLMESGHGQAAGSRAVRDDAYRTLADARGPTVGAKETPSLLVQLDTLEKQLAVIAEGVSRVQCFKERLLTPRPQTIEKDTRGPNHPSNSVEARLCTLADVAHEIGARLHNILNELDRAA